MPTPDAQSPIVVVLDTNIWESTHLLQSWQGASLLHYLQQSGMRLALPEVVEEELKARAASRSLDAFNAIEKNVNDLYHFSGHDIRRALPSIDDLGHGVEQALRKMSVVIDRVPITLEHVRSALKKVIAKIPPTTKKEAQFRDTLIWEAAISFLASSSVHFITDDTKFYEGDKITFTRRLLETLEPMQCSNLHCHATLLGCLEALNVMKAMSPDDRTNIVALIKDWIAGRLEAHYRGSNVHLTIHDLAEGNVFRGDAPSGERIAFDLRYELSGTVDDKYGHGSIRVRGEGLGRGLGVTNALLNDVGVSWETGDFADYHGNRTTKFKGMEDGNFRLEFCTWIVSGEQEEEWYRWIASHGITFQRPFEVIGASGPLSYLGITGVAPSLEVWEKFLSDMEKREITSLVVEGPMPWQWGNDS